MADLNGLVVLEKMRQIEYLKNTPIIMLTLNPARPQSSARTS